MNVFTFKMKRVFSLVTGLFIATAATAQSYTPTTEPVSVSPFSSVLFIAMLAIAILLMLGIVGMAEMVKAGAAMKKIRDKKPTENKDVVKTIALLLLVSMGGSLFAQNTMATAPVVAEVPFNYWGMGGGIFYGMLLLIILEAIIFYVLYRTGILLLRNEKAAKAIAAKQSWFAGSAVIRSMTEATTPQEEEALLMDHEYDGIRELDNNLPGWWKYGFYLTIVVAVIYLFNYHVLGTGPSSSQEYENEKKQAEQQIAEYRKSTANLVDENTVVRLTDAVSLSAGHAVFTQNCIPCHGQFAEGKEGLGPNLTDDYWKHGGGTVGIFKSIKYGWTDRGMKSWEQDLKPLEIQQIVSWIQSIRGSKPANAKAPEGELYTEESSPIPVSDSLKSDSTPPIPVADTVKK